MVRRMRAVNGFSTAMASTVTSGTTTWPLDSVTGLDTEGDFYLSSGDEIVLVTHIDVGLKEVTVIRGQADTTAEGHAGGANVSAVSTADEFYTRMNELGARKVLPFGRIMTGTGTILTASNFSLQNGAGSTVNDGSDGIIRLESKTHSSNDVTGATRNFSNVNDWRITAHMSCPAIEGSGVPSPTPEYFGLAARQSTGGQVKGIWLRPGRADPTGPNWGKVRVDERASFQNVGFTALATSDICGRRDMWLRLEIEWDVVATTDHFRWYCSFDGVHFVLLHTHMFAAGQHQVGIWANNDHGPAGKRYFINSWLEEALTF